MKNRGSHVTHAGLNNENVAVLKICLLRWKETKIENKRRRCEGTKVGVSCVFQFVFH